MGKLTKIICLTALAYCLCGFAHEQYREYNTHYEVRQFVETIHESDTIDSILSHYYNEANEGKGWNEWKFDTLHLEANKHLLNDKGYLKTYYPGQKLTIRCRVRVQDD